MIRRCDICHKEKDDSVYWISDGITTYTNVCKECSEKIREVIRLMKKNRTA